METKEIKAEIASKIEEMNEEQLKAVSDFISKLAKERRTEINLAKHADSIMERYDAVLRKLAE